MVTSLPVSYATVSDVYETLPGFETQGITSVTTGEISFQLGQAQALINAKLAKNYALPFDATPPALVGITLDFAIYTLFARTVETEGRDNPWAKRYEMSSKLLDELSSGEIPLVTASGTVITGTNAVAQVWSQHSTYNPPVFPSGGDEFAWRQDRDLIDAEAEARSDD